MTSYRWALGMGVVGMLTQGIAYGQLLERQKNRISLVYAMVDMTYSGASIGDIDPSVFRTYDYRGPVVGLQYEFARSRAGIASGRQGGDGLWMVDAWLITDDLSSLAEFAAGTLRFAFPVAAGATYRRVALRGNAGGTGFTSSSLGVGVGITVEGPIKHASRWALASRPIVGIASSPQTDALGWAWMLETGLQVRLPNAWGRIGLTGGYTVRYQVWNNRGTRVFGEYPDEFYDYQAIQHGLVGGISF